MCSKTSNTFFFLANKIWGNFYFHFYTFLYYLILFCFVWTTLFRKKDNALLSILRSKFFGFPPPPIHTYLLAQIGDISRYLLLPMQLIYNFRFVNSTLIFDFQSPWVTKDSISLLLFKNKQWTSPHPKCALRPTCSCHTGSILCPLRRWSFYKALSQTLSRIHSRKPINKFWLPHNLTTNSLLFTGSHTDNINSRLTYILHVLIYAIFL